MPCQIVIKPIFAYSILASILLGFKASRMPNAFHSEQYKIFIELLRKTRVDLGVSQAVLAQKLGFPQAFVSKCETGIRRVDVIELNAWLRALNVEFPEFVATLTEQWDAHLARTHLLRGESRRR